MDTKTPYLHFLAKGQVPIWTSEILHPLLQLGKLYRLVRELIQRQK